MFGRSRAVIAHAVAGIVLLIVGFGGGWICALMFGSYVPMRGAIAAMFSPTNAQTPQEIRQQFSVFWETWHLVDQDFYHEEPLDRQRMITGSINGMLASLDDPYTVYQEPDLAAQSNDNLRGSFEGIGAYIRIANGKAYISRPMENSPALRAGLQQDDEILKIDGEVVSPFIEDLDTSEAHVKVAARIRGPKGTAVTLTIRREFEGQPFDVVIERDEVIVSSVQSAMLDNDVAYLKISGFKTTTPNDFDLAMRKLLAQQPQGLVLDLRDNPGGYLKPAQEVLGRFYEGVALYEKKTGGEVLTLNTIKGPANTRAFDLPLVVLVNGRSASASEIVAGALRDMRESTYLIGETTFGKGSVQNIHQLSNGANVRVTTAYWLTPGKQTISNVGITPEYVVAMTDEPTQMVPCVADNEPLEGQSGCADDQLAAAIQFLTEGQLPREATSAVRR
ncbi:MAG: hypothetical protein GFH27_549279n82 [Chloroflexi bacterium AL-W]|nr:hypothetical protein [Chloroflexi bacterium AL-N1]NOK65048.1 hypothetical protein [Chloroflexi bacterium AL-N10]NOK72685.1 hypothetical protein [Chloroflexi bacterium AL-N5]NOK79227.1 hypothetical protein [Chloroflexi bacterium AL-W]NOK87143.1 hypothetical protein [Chloroflexi bacterium AL-N15]